jgi:O-antigen biosynthesis protein
MSVGNGYLDRHTAAANFFVRRLVRRMPTVAHLVRKLRHLWRRSVGLAKVLCREPRALSLLALGFEWGGAKGLRQAIRILVPPFPCAHQGAQQWFDATRPSPALLDQFRRRSWPADAPRFTIIIPVYNVREEWLREAIESVIAQTYPHWELICVNDHSPAAHTRPVLDRLSARDPRVKVVHSPTNRGVSAATNLGLKKATGDYVAFMDHDDFLEPHALHRLAEAVLKDRPDMIYTDEAVTGVDIGSIQHVACRPSFSYDYYLCYPYIVHLIAARTELVRRVGGLNEEMKISQDIDFVLRLIETCREISHVPEVLYRWRTHPASLGHQEQHNVGAMTRGAFERHFERIGVAVDIDDKPHFNFRDMTFALTAPARVAIIITATDCPDRLLACVTRLECTVPPDLAELVILDRSPIDTPMRSLLDDLARRHRVVRSDGRLNTSALLNRGAAATTTASHYLFLDDDCQVRDTGWLPHMLGYGERADVGIVGATLVDHDDRVRHAGLVVGVNGTHDRVLTGAHFRVPERGRCAGPNGMLLAGRDCSAVSASCLLVRADVFAQLGGFDEEIADRHHDLDLCLRARALGYKVIQDAYAVLERGGGEITNAEPGQVPWNKLWRLVTRHAATLFGGDLYYSPLLSAAATDMAFAPARRAPRRVRSRTVPVVLPRGTTGSKQFRVDSGSQFQPIGHGVRVAASADQS